MLRTVPVRRSPFFREICSAFTRAPPNNNRTTQDVMNFGTIDLIEMIPARPAKRCSSAKTSFDPRYNRCSFKIESPLFRSVLEQDMFFHSDLAFCALFHSEMLKAQ